MVAELRDFSVATYSEESVTGCGFITSTFTRISGGGPCGPCGFELQPPRPIANVRAREVTRVARPGMFNFRTLFRIVTLIARSRPAFEQTHHLLRCHRFSSVFLPAKSSLSLTTAHTENHQVVGSKWEPLMLPAALNACRAPVCQFRTADFHKFLFGTVDPK